MKNYCASLKNKLNHKRIQADDIMIFFRQFATLISAGIPVIRVLDLLTQSQSKMLFRQLLRAIKADILAGNSISQSLLRHPQHFDALSCHLVRISETAGKLDVVLLDIADHQEKRVRFIQNIKQALFYPAIVSITGIATLCCLFIFIIPRFAELFADKQNELPLLTRWIFSFSMLLQTYCGWLFLFSLLLLIPVFFYKNKIHSLKVLKNWFYQFPILHRCRRQVSLAQFARQLSLTLAAGIPLIEALALIRVSEPAFILAIRQLRFRVASGLQLHQAMETLILFPVFLRQMVKLGEESGQLVHLLDKSAEFYETEVSQTLQRLCRLLEPLIMLLLGVLIGGLVISMYLPIFKLGSTL